MWTAHCWALVMAQVWVGRFRYSDLKEAALSGGRWFMGVEWGCVASGGVGGIGSGVESELEAHVGCSGCASE